MYQEYSLSRAETQVQQMEKVLTQQNQARELELNAVRGEVASLKKVDKSFSGYVNPKGGYFKHFKWNKTMSQNNLK